ncbi:IS4 family transposase [Actinomadura litoris]|uniref:IS4 family transposase n=1 Tax=Actinomadura litoris TaxID=2678616 RepID=UPI001FA7FBA2|nr:IS4 family transposase [Actinomadura litoris]
MAGQLVDLLTLGELDWVFPTELMDSVLAKTQDREVRHRLLPPRLMIYFMLARAMLCPCPYRKVLLTMAEAAGGQSVGDDWRMPDKAAIFRARRKLGTEPFQELLVHAGSAVADERTPGAFWRGLRVMVLDGTTLQAADSPANQAGLGRPRPQRDKGSTGCPPARLVGLIEAGTHVVCDAAVGPHRIQERVLAERLAGSLGPRTLVLAGRGLSGARLWRRWEATGADLLWRVPESWELPVQQPLSDSSWISTMDASRGCDRPFQRERVRVIEDTLNCPGRHNAERCRLITTLTDPRAASAADLVGLYGQRAEGENTLAELKTTQIGARTVLPSKSPDLIFQEIYAHLAVYTGLRVLMHATAVNRSQPLDPDRLSFAAALRAARRSLTTPVKTAPPSRLLDRDW